MKLALALLLGGISTLQASRYAGLWLQVSDEVAPAGGVAQVLVTLTEPKPIIRANLALSFDPAVVDDVLSVAIYSENGEAIGTAIRRGNVLLVEAASPTGNLGWSEDYPVLSATFRLRSDAPPGARSVLSLTQESVFYKPGGEVWTIESNAPGSVTAQGQFSVDGISPETGQIQPGQVIQIHGSGFQPTAQVAIQGVTDVKVAYQSPSALQVTASSAFQIDQRKVVVSNPDRTAQTYYPYIKSVEFVPSMYDLTAAVIPLFSPAGYADTSIQLAGPLAGNFSDSGPYAGIALQNAGQDAQSVRLDVVSPEGDVLASTSVALMPNERVVRDLAEMYPGTVIPTGSTLHVNATGPIQALGFTGNRNEGRAVPIVPGSAT